MGVIFMMRLLAYDRPTGSSREPPHSHCDQDSEMGVEPGLQPATGTTQKYWQFARNRHINTGQPIVYIFQPGSQVHIIAIKK